MEIHILKAAAEEKTSTMRAASLMLFGRMAWLDNVSGIRKATSRPTFISAKGRREKDR